MTASNNIPIFMREEVSKYVLRKYPQYRHVFMRCPNCNKFSLKPTGFYQLQQVSHVVEIKDRKCSLCGYTNVRLNPKKKEIVK